MHLVIFDLETTGYSPRYHEIIQIAAVRMRHGKVAKERFATFVRPRNAIPGFISELTGITQRDVLDAPEAPAALMEFSRFVGDATLVAHNGRRFDLPFVRESCLRHRLALREVPFFDSITLSRRIWKNERTHNLDAVTERLGLSAANLRRHDARDDVHILSQVVRRMWQRLGTPLDHCPVSLEVGHLPRIAAGADRH
jgi:DNA polymerase III epsilon subunit family exonuclease